MSDLVIEDLVVKRAGKVVLGGVSLRLSAGRITALLGPNGAGKSSLVLALAGVLPIEAGTISLDGAALSGCSPELIRRRGIAAILEGHRVLDGLTVDENLRAAGFQHDAAELKRAISDVYDLFPELTDRRSQRARSLSGGQQQILALGQALVARPRFILADEMSLGLAPLIVKRLMGVLARLAQAGTGVLLIEQFTAVALQLASEVCVISRGRLTYSGLPAPLIDDPEILHRSYLA
jgi:branched-chain amino acid transport system ATP-binding protein